MIIFEKIPYLVAWRIFAHNLSGTKSIFIRFCPQSAIFVGIKYAKKNII